MLDKIWLIPLVPLAGSAIAGLAGLINLRLTGQRLDRRLVSIIALSSVGLAFLLSAGAVF